MKKLHIFVLALSLAPSAFAQIIMVDTFPAFSFAKDIGYNGPGGYEAVNRFVAAEDFSAMSFQARLNVVTGGNGRISLYSSHSFTGLPSSGVIATAFTLNSGFSGIVDFTFSTAIPLTAGNTYWVGLGLDTGVAGKWFYGDGDSSSEFMDRYGQSGFPWTTFGRGSAMAYSITGVPASAVPEPSTYGSLAVSMLILAGLARRYWRTS